MNDLNKEKSVDDLITALKDFDPFVRMDAAFELGRRLDKRAVEPLIALLSDEHRHVRRDAALALGEIKDERAVEPMMEVYKSTQESPIAKAIWMITGRNIEDEMFGLRS